MFRPRCGICHFYNEQEDLGVGKCSKNGMIRHENRRCKEFKIDAHFEYVRNLFIKRVLLATGFITTIILLVR